MRHRLRGKAKDLRLTLASRGCQQDLAFAFSCLASLWKRTLHPICTYAMVCLGADTLQLTIWLVPAGTVDRLGYSQPAYLEVENKLLREPVDDTALQA